VNLLEEMARQLALSGFGRAADGEQDGNIYWGHMPDRPDTCVCVYAEDNALPGSAAGARVRVVCRSASLREAYGTAAAIGDKLDGFRGFLGGDGADAAVDAGTTAVSLGADEKKRELYATDLRVRYCE